MPLRSVRGTNHGQSIREMPKLSYGLRIRTSGALGAREELGALLVLRSPKVAPHATFGKQNFLQTESTTPA